MGTVCKQKEEKIWRHQKLIFKNFGNLREPKYRTAHYNQKRWRHILNFLQRFGHQRVSKIALQCDLAKVPEAIYWKPLTLQVPRWDHWLQGTRQTYRQNIVKIEIVVVLNWFFFGRSIVECPSLLNTLFYYIANFTLISVAISSTAEHWKHRIWSRVHKIPTGIRQKEECPRN